MKTEEAIDRFNYYKDAAGWVVKPDDWIEVKPVLGLTFKTGDRLRLKERHLNLVSGWVVHALQNSSPNQSTVFVHVKYNKVHMPLDTTNRSLQLMSDNNSIEERILIPVRKLKLADD